MRRLLVAVPAAALVLTGCATSDPRQERRADVAQLTDAANDRDVDAVRDEVDDLLATLRAQVADGRLDRAEADRLRQLAQRIDENAELLEPSPSPSPTPSPSPSPSPSPTPEETEEPEQTEEPDPPEQTEDPDQPDQPDQTEQPQQPEQSPTPTQVSQPGAEPSPPADEPSPQPTA